MLLISLSCKTVMEMHEEIFFFLLSHKEQNEHKNTTTGSSGDGDKS